MIAADEHVRARAAAGVHPEIVRRGELEKLRVALGVAAPEQEKTVAASEGLYVFGQLGRAELRRGGGGRSGGRRRGGRGLRHEPGLFGAIQIGPHGLETAFQHGEPALAAAGLVEQGGHVFAYGQLRIESQIDGAFGAVQRDGGALLLRRKTVQLRLEQAGGFLTGHHPAEPFLFRLQLEQELAQTVGLGEMRFGGFGAGQGGDAAQDLRFSGGGAGPERVFDDQLLAGCPVGVPSALGRQGPRRQFAVPGGVLVEEQVPASGFEVQQQGGLLVGRQQGKRAAQRRGEHGPVAPAVARAGFRPTGGIGPCGRFRLGRRGEEQGRPLAQVKTQPALGVAVDAQVQTAAHPIDEHVDDAAVRQVFAQAHGFGRRRAADGNLVGGEEQEWGLATGAEEEEAFSGCSVEREQGHVPARLMDFFDPAPHERGRKLVAQAAEHMAVHAMPREIVRDGRRPPSDGKPAGGETSAGRLNYSPRMDSPSS